MPAQSTVTPPRAFPAWAAPFLDRIRTDVPLADMTTIRIGGPAPILVEPRDAADAALCLSALREAGECYGILGGGSNLLVGDEPLQFVVLHPSRLDSVSIDGSHVRAGAGVTLSNLIARTTDAGLGGLETLAGIPGQIGGAIAMNAGGRYGEIGQFVDTVDLALPSGRIETVTAADLAFSYRSSRIPAGALVAAVTFRLRPGDRLPLKREAGRILKEKNAAQPTTGWNFGCIFKNPVGQSAGKLVDAAGLKGIARGEARVSPLHGNFVENMGTASAKDVLALIEELERGVLGHAGVKLEREVRVWMSRAV